MSEQQLYRQYADECIASARSALDDVTRQRFLDLAKLWMMAAQQMDDGLSVAPGEFKRAGRSKASSAKGRHRLHHVIR
jgi:hypothetical protein